MLTTMVSNIHCWFGPPQQSKSHTPLPGTAYGMSRHLPASPRIALGWTAQSCASVALQW